ncbi:MAG: hypothetical protein KA327_11635 [Pseudarcicella sp.]|nr:hypothetical protein [Pseudarcicella sp.]
MTHLDNILIRINSEIEKSIQKFVEENGIPKTLGIYCCPWAGWLTTNFNLSKDEQNCPDFEFVEFDLIELPEIEEEHQNEKPIFKIGEILTTLNTNDFGDEAINEFIFNSLKSSAIKINEIKNIEVVVQMLDSQYAEKIK